MSSHTDFALTSGSVIGREHRRVSRNCQDDAYIMRCDTHSIAIVADGCGSGEQSEVGAALGVRLVAEALHQELLLRPPEAIRWWLVERQVLAKLHELALALGGHYGQVVQDYFLFTVVGVVLAKERAIFFAAGDGLVAYNDEVLELGPFPENKPPYLAYQLFAEPAEAAACGLKIVHELPQDELERFWIGSDGMADLLAAADKPLPGTDQLVGAVYDLFDGKCFNNPVLASRRLKLVARDRYRADASGALVEDAGLLPDDTTLVIGQKLPQPIKEPDGNDLHS